MKQKERLDEKVKQERTEPDHHRKIIIKGILFTGFVQGAMLDELWRYYCKWDLHLNR